MSEVEQAPTSHQHFSSRLGRYWQASDVLYLDEVAEVLSENSGRLIATKYVTGGRNHYVQYSEVQYRRVINQPGRRKKENPTPNALRQREFKARRATSANRNDK